MSNDLVLMKSVLTRNPWLGGYSNLLPIYSGKDGCLGHWISWNRGTFDLSEQNEPQNTGDDAIDITPVAE